MFVIYASFYVLTEQPCYDVYYALLSAFRTFIRKQPVFMINKTKKKFTFNIMAKGQFECMRVFSVDYVNPWTAVRNAYYIPHVFFFCDMYNLGPRPLK
jgi:hypothetical protein